MNSVDRFKKRKKIIGSISVYESVDKELVNEFLNSEVDKSKVEASFKIVDEHYDFKYDFTVSKDEAKEFLEQFKKDFNQERFDKLIIDCRKEVINSIVTPFGLGKIIAAYDKAGGNVTTVHNANNKDFIDFDGEKYKKGVYAQQEDEYNRNDYTNTKNSNGQQFAGNGKNSVGSNFTKSKMDNDNNVIDAYTGKTQRADTTSPDHIESLSQYHKDGGFMQSNKQKADFGTDENNLALTDRSINQSMRDFSKENWKDKESEKGLKNKDKFGIDEEKLNNELKKAKEVKENHLPTNLEKGEYYLKNSASTGLNEGSKMGMQQAIGLVMTEFFTALFDEILDIYKNGFSNGFEDDRFFIVLKDRLKNIALKIQAKWKNVAIAFKDGFLSGFISNLVTTAINMFVTTGKRVVRIIREGIFSLFKAIKMLIFPPENMTYEEAMHEAKKVVASGLIISLGVIAEQYIDTLIKGSVILEPFSDILTTIFVGAITGLAVTMTVYYIDKKKNDKDAIKKLINDTDEKFENLEVLLNKLS
jgi:hypothetical protein